MSVERLTIASGQPPVTAAYIAREDLKVVLSVWERGG